MAKGVRSELTIYSARMWDEERGKWVHTPTYKSYRAMLDRCYRPTHPRFYRYGGRMDDGYDRNIEVCDLWRYGDSWRTGFECFVDDIGVRPGLHLSLERERTDDDYQKDNCKWATDTEQTRNRRNTRFVTIDNVTMPLGEAVERFGVKKYYGNIMWKIWKGGDAEETIRLYAARLPARGQQQQGNEGQAT